MTKPKEAQVLMLLPDGTARDVLRAGVMALRCVPTNLPATASERAVLLADLALDARVFMLVDISSDYNRPADTFAEMVRAVPAWLKARTVLTRLAAGHVNAADRAWVKALGFRDLITDLDTQDRDGDLHTLLNSVANSLNLPPLPAAELTRYIKAATPHTPRLPRALIRQQTGMSAEHLVQLLGNKLDIRDRTYHLKNYPSCFLGSDAVAWLAGHFTLPPSAAVDVGQSLGTLGLLHHVEHKHVFSNQPLFFRLAQAVQADDIPLGGALDTLRQKVTVADRTYLGTVYAHCWVGTQAVDVICQHYAVPRHAGQLVLQRLMQFGLLAHVVNDQPFIDGNYFYRFATTSV